MTIHFIIPTWLLWVLGVPAGLAVLFCAVIGVIFLWIMRKGLNR